MPPPSTPSRKRLSRPVGLGMALALLGLFASVLPVTFVLEEILGLGLLFAVRGPVAPPKDVVVVGISRAAARELELSPELDTWSREVHARLVERLNSAGATAIAFDLMFFEPREQAGDARFATSIAEAGNVLLLEETTESDVVPLGAQSTGRWEVRTPPLASFKAGALGTGPFILPKVPVRVSQAWTFDRLTDETPSLPALALQAHLLSHYDDFVRLLEVARPGSTASWPATRDAVVQERQLELTVGSMRHTFRRDPGLAAAALAQLRRERPDPVTAAALASLVNLYSGANSRHLNFYGPARIVRTIPYDQALSGAHDEEFAGKVVLVGMSEPRQPRQDDDFISVFSQNTGINLSGVEIGATAVANLLEGRMLNRLPLAVHVALVVALGALIGLLVGRMTVVQAGATVAVGAVSYFAIALWQFGGHSVWLPLVVPMLVQLPIGFAVAAWWGYRDVTVQRERIRTALGYYLPASAARRLTEQAVAPGADRELLHGTCLVTDAEHYTSVAESLTPNELAVLMNDYYDGIFRVVQLHGGEISDTAGDSMIAVWATSLPDAAVRSRAAQASLAILDSVTDFNRRHPETPLPTRIGLESGEMLLGNIGGEQRYEYRAVGDIVNTAARIQGLNQLLGTRVLISAATFTGMTELQARDVGTFLLRGKRLPVRVLEPARAAALPLDDRALAAFAAALAAFRAGDWQHAHENFAALVARYPGDGPSRYYEAMSGAFRAEPPVNWAGFVRLTAK